MNYSSRESEIIRVVPEMSWCQEGMLECSIWLVIKSQRNGPVKSHDYQKYGYTFPYLLIYITIYITYNPGSVNKEWNISIIIAIIVKINHGLSSGDIKYKKNVIIYFYQEYQSWYCDIIHIHMINDIVLSKICIEKYLCTKIMLCNYENMNTTYNCMNSRYYW